MLGIALVAVVGRHGPRRGRLQDSRKAAGVGLALSVFGLATVLVFFMGADPGLRGRAACCSALRPAARRCGAGLGGAAIAVGALALLGYVAIYVTDLII